MIRGKLSVILAAAVFGLGTQALLAQHGHGGGLHLGNGASMGGGTSVGKAMSIGSSAPSIGNSMSIGSGATPMGGGFPASRASSRASSAPGRSAALDLPGSANSFGRDVSAARLSSNPALSVRSQALLPPGTSVRTAARGFRNQEEFLTTLHLSRDLNIPFSQLKARTTGKRHESLQDAVADLRPGLSHSQIKSNIHMAQRQTGRDIAVARVATHANSNRFLANRVQNLLPAGMTLQTASAGFRNQGQFLAALHVSHNLGIPFTQLKAKMTGPNPESLGRAIQDLRPGTSKGIVKSNVETAEREAENDAEMAREREIETMVARR